MPVQCLDAGAATIHKHKQRITERVHDQFLFDNGRQAVDLFAEVDRLAVQINCTDPTARVHYRPPVADIRSASQWGSGNWGKSKWTPGANVRVQARAEALAEPTCTGTSWRLVLTWLAASALKRLRQ